MYQPHSLIPWAPGLSHPAYPFTQWRQSHGVLGKTALRETFSKKNRVMWKRTLNVPTHHLKTHFFYSKHLQVLEQWKLPASSHVVWVTMLFTRAWSFSNCFPMYLIIFLRAYSKPRWAKPLCAKGCYISLQSSGHSVYRNVDWDNYMIHFVRGNCLKTQDHHFLNVTGINDIVV